MNKRHLMVVLACALMVGTAHAQPTSQAQGGQGARVGNIVVNEAWARPTVSGQAGGGGFLTVRNIGQSPDRLVGAQSDVASATELHEMKMEGDVMRMREVGAIAVPAAGQLKLQPGGYHIMFMGLKAPLSAGSRFPLTLTFEKAGAVTLEVVVQASPPAAHGVEKGHHGGPGAHGGSGGHGTRPSHSH